LDLAVDGNKTFEIGGSDQVSYGGLMKEYARQRGLKRFVMSVPLLTPRLSSLWLGLVTPVYVRVGRKLIESICHATVVEDQTALAVFKIRPRGYREAISAAIAANERHLILDSRTIHVTASPEDAFIPIRRIGGKRGWYHADWLWGLRGFVDRLFGGIGLRRGRRDPDSLRVGDTVDFWRVEVLEPNHLLRLTAEMKLPGQAWLEFEVTKDPTGSVIRQTAMFNPKGVLGRAYWYAIFPLHQFIFGGMLRGIAAAGAIKD
jgi:hypothetical protein